MPERRAVALGTSVFPLRDTVGAYWEIFEWFFVAHYTMADTISALLVDSGSARGARPPAIRRPSHVESPSGPSFENSPSTCLGE